MREEYCTELVSVKVLKKKNAILIFCAHVGCIASYFVHAFCVFDDLTPFLCSASVALDFLFVSLVLSTGIGPVLGLLFIPLIGSASDHFNSRYGRRWPFIWMLSFGVLMALFIIPHADDLASRLSWGGHSFKVVNLIVYNGN